MGYPRPYVNVTKQDDRNLICGLAGAAHGSKACLVCTVSWIWSPVLQKLGMMAQPVMSALRKQTQENPASQGHPQLPKPGVRETLCQRIKRGFADKLHTAIRCAIPICTARRLCSGLCTPGSQAARESVSSSRSPWENQDYSSMLQRIALYRFWTFRLGSLHWCDNVHWAVSSLKTSLLFYFVLFFSFLVTIGKFHLKVQFWCFLKLKTLYWISFSSGNYHRFRSWSTPPIPTCVRVAVPLSCSPTVPEHLWGSE